MKELEIMRYEDMEPLKFRTENGNMVGTLTMTLHERGQGYKWIPTLALLDDKGRWLCSGWWKPNAWRQAEKDLLSMGYVKL